MADDYDSDTVDGEEIVFQGFGLEEETGPAPSSVVDAGAQNDAERSTSAAQASEVHMLILVGAQCSGKSTLSNQLSKRFGWAIVNQDLSGSRSACVHDSIRALRKGQSVIVDRTNTSAWHRTFFVDVAKECGSPVDCLWLDTPLEDCIARLKVRDQNHPTFPYNDKMVGLLKSTYNSIEGPRNFEGFRKVFVMSDLTSPKEFAEYLGVPQNDEILQAFQCGPEENTPMMDASMLEAGLVGEYGQEEGPPTSGSIVSKLIQAAHGLDKSDPEDESRPNPPVEEKGRSIMSMLNKALQKVESDDSTGIHPDNGAQVEDPEPEVLPNGEPSVMSILLNAANRSKAISYGDDDGYGGHRVRGMRGSYRDGYDCTDDYQYRSESDEEASRGGDECYREGEDYSDEEDAESYGDEEDYEEGEEDYEEGEEEEDEDRHEGGHSEGEGEKGDRGGDECCREDDDYDEDEEEEEDRGGDECYREDDEDDEDDENDEDEDEDEECRGGDECYQENDDYDEEDEEEEEEYGGGDECYREAGDYGDEDEDEEDEEDEAQQKESGDTSRVTPSLAADGVVLAPPQAVVDSDQAVRQRLQRLKDRLRSHTTQAEEMGSPPLGSPTTPNPCPPRESSWIHSPYGTTSPYDAVTPVQPQSPFEHSAPVQDFIRKPQETTCPATPTPDPDVRQPEASTGEDSGPTSPTLQLYRQTPTFGPEVPLVYPPPLRVSTEGKAASLPMLPPSLDGPSKFVVPPQSRKESQGPKENVDANEDGKEAEVQGTESVAESTNGDGMGVDATKIRDPESADQTQDEHAELAQNVASIPAATTKWEDASSGEPEGPPSDTSATATPTVTPSEANDASNMQPEESVPPTVSGPNLAPKPAKSFNDVETADSAAEDLQGGRPNSSSVPTPACPVHAPEDGKAKDSAKARDKKKGSKDCKVS